MALLPKDNSASRNLSYPELVPLDSQVLTTRLNYVVSHVFDSRLERPYDREAVLAYATEIGEVKVITEFKC